MSTEPIKRGMNRYVSDEVFQRENEECRTSALAQVYTGPIGGAGPFQSIGTIDPSSAPWVRLTDEESPTVRSFSIRRTETFALTIEKVNRKVLRTYFGDRLPRSARSLRRRRNKLRRKRINRRRNR